MSRGEAPDARGGWRGVLIVVLAVMASSGVVPAAAQAASSDPAAAAGAAPAPYSASALESKPGAVPGKAKVAADCSVGQILLNVLNPFSNCQPLNQAGQAVVNGVASLPGTIAGAAATGVMDQVTSWMVQAAQTISGWVVKEADLITRPELDASWYASLFSGLAALGAALAGLVALIALGSAAIRKDPDALGEVIYGIARAGIGTSVVVALTIIALTAADSISNGFARQMPADFYKTLASQWGGTGWGGFGAAALAFLVAFVATIAGLVVWLELVVREAAIYIAVLFFPVALAASIWPTLQMWVRRLGMLLTMFVLLRPVVVIVLALAGNVTSAGLSFGHGSIPHSVGTILAGVVIFALAAFTPWALMFLLGTEVGVMHSRGERSAAAGGSGRGLTSEREGGRIGGALPGGQLQLAGGGGLAAATAGAGASEGGSSTGARGFRLASLGGSGAPGPGASPGPIAAASGWIGGLASAAGRAGGQLGQHAAARIHVAAGRSGVAPGGLLPPSAGGLEERQPDRGPLGEPGPSRSGAGGGEEARSFEESLGLPSPPSPEPSPRPDSEAAAIEPIPAAGPPPLVPPARLHDAGPRPDGDPQVGDDPDSAGGGE